MNTKKVSMFFVHYITELDDDDNDDQKNSKNKTKRDSYSNNHNTKQNIEKRNIYPSIGVILHYKEYDKSIYGQILRNPKLNEVKKSDYQDNCKENGVINYKDVTEYINTDISEKLIKTIENNK